MSSKVSEAINKVSNDRLEDLIRDALMVRTVEQDSDLRIEEFDIAVRKELGQPITIEIRVYGSAGNTTKDEFADANGKVVKGGGSFSIKLDDDTVAKFVFAEVLNLDATDYQVTYKLAS
jgi:hypothetical protein